MKPDSSAEQPSNVGEGKAASEKLGQEADPVGDTGTDVGPKGLRGTEAGKAAADQDSPRLTPQQVQQLLIIGLIGFSLTVFVLAELFSAPHSGRTAPSPGSIRYTDVSSRDHVIEPAVFPQDPPVGGEHTANWQNCGFYDKAIPPGPAIHSLEHGAVWVTYREDLAEDELDVLRRVAATGARVLVSPWGGNLPSPIVVSAWNSQQALPSASDPALATFLRQFVDDPSSPEHDGPCSGGQG